MKIDDFAKRLGIKYHQVYYYERIGVFPCAERDARGDRVYTEEDVEECIGLLEAHKAKPKAKDMLASRRG